MKTKENTLVRARVDSTKYRKAERVFKRLGMNSGDAINIFMAQVALRGDLPFAVTAHPERLQSDEEQAQAWKESYGDY